MSPSTLRAYATRFSIRRSFSAAGSGVGNMACTLTRKSRKKQNSATTWCTKFYSVFIWHNASFCNTSVSVLDLQFVHQVGAQVLSDVFMPGLPYPRSRERGGSGQVSHASRHWPIWHQLTIRHREKESITSFLNSDIDNSIEGFINTSININNIMWIHRNPRDWEQINDDYL